MVAEDEELLEFIGGQLGVPAQLLREVTRMQVSSGAKLTDTLVQLGFCSSEQIESIIALRESPEAAKVVRRPPGMTAADQRFAHVLKPRDQWTSPPGGSPLPPLDSQAPTARRPSTGALPVAPSARPSRPGSPRKRPQTQKRDSQSTSGQLPQLPRRPEGKSDRPRRRPPTGPAKKAMAAADALPAKLVAAREQAGTDPDLFELPEDFRLEDSTYGWTLERPQPSAAPVALDLPFDLAPGDPTKAHKAETTAVGARPLTSDLPPVKKASEAVAPMGALASFLEPDPTPAGVEVQTIDEDVEEALSGEPTGATQEQPTISSLPEDDTPRPTKHAQAPADSVLPTFENGPDRYVLGEEIARGGMGRIVSTIDKNIDRPVAMKLLIRGTEEQLGLQLRFTEEAQITGQLQHPNIVPVYDLGTMPDGRIFFTMKLLKGQTLRDVLRQLRRRVPEAEKDFGRARLLGAFMQLCMGVAYANDRGVVHRDLKPSNIMFGDYGEVLIMDWGLAKIVPMGAEAQVRSYRDEQSGWSTRHGEVIGTPGYMPPELALGQLDDVDQRSDVFSLGAILYEILTLRPPYTGKDARTILKKMLREPVVPPSRRAPNRDIDPTLEEIAMRCLAKPMDGRFRDARTLHAAIEAYMNSALEKGRKRESADQQVEHAQHYAQTFDQLDEVAERLEAKTEAAQLRIAPWDGPEARRALWDLEAQLQTARRERMEIFTRAVQCYRQALVFDATHRVAREGLCKLYWKRFMHAEAAGDRNSMSYYETLLRDLDAKEYSHMLKGDGRLTIETDPPGARVALFEYSERDRVLTPGAPQDLGTTPVTIDPLPMGRYLLLARAAGMRDTRIPIRIERLADLSLHARLRAEHPLGNGFVYIPGGRFTVGGDREASWSLPRQTARVADFWLARLPVSCRQYLDFLNALARADLDTARKRVPRLFASGGPLFVESDGAFTIPPRDPSGVPWDPNWPIFGVSARDAESYCAWRGAEDGVAYRLPTELEWEVAARGADERRFVWGDHWEPTYCKCAHSKPGPAHLEPCGAYPHDRSPYGVMDLAGGVADWTATKARDDSDEHVCRGGRWDTLELNARAASRQAMAPDSVSVSVGFRLAFTP